MKQQYVLYGIIGVLVGILIGVFISSYAVNNNSYGMMRMMGFRSGDSPRTMMGNAGSIDQHFIEQMIPHHEDAVTMANLAFNKAKRNEIKTLATNIADSQTKEIDQMKEWYKNWYGKDVPQDEQVMGGHMMEQSNSMHMGMMGDETDMARLETTSDFDKAFIEDMIPHHQMAIMMATMLKNGTNRPEMKKLADDIIEAQSVEIEQMRTWYGQWYK